MVNIYTQLIQIREELKQIIQVIWSITFFSILKIVVM